MKCLDEFLDKQFDFNSYTCADFVVEVWRFLTGEDLTECKDEFTLRTQRMNLLSRREKLDEPVEPCLVLISRENETPHVGVYYDAKLIHLNSLIGVRRHKLEDLPKGYVVDFYA